MAAIAEALQPGLREMRVLFAFPGLIQSSNSNKRGKGKEKRKKGQLGSWHPQHPAIKQRASLYPVLIPSQRSGSPASSLGGSEWTPRFPLSSQGFVVVVVVRLLSPSEIFLSLLHSLGLQSLGEDTA